MTQQHHLQQQQQQQQTQQIQGQIRPLNQQIPEGQNPRIYSSGIQQQPLIQQQKQAQMQQQHQQQQQPIQIKSQLQQQQQIQQQKIQQQHYQSNSIAATIAKVSSTGAIFQAQSPQSQQQPTTSSSPSSSTSASQAQHKISNFNLPSTSSAGSSSAPSPLANIQSPLKTEYTQQYQTHQQQQHVFQKPSSPVHTKTIAKLIKTDDALPNSPASPNVPVVAKSATQTVSEYESEFDVISMVDLPAEKKLLNASTTTSSTAKMTSLDQIRSLKDEKFLNIMILHKKFVECAKKYKLEDVNAEVATLVSHATQEYLRNIICKLNVVTQHRLDMSMRSNDSYEVTNDVKSQIRFIEELDKIEKKKKDEAEREKLMKAAKVILLYNFILVNKYYFKYFLFECLTESVKR